MISIIFMCYDFIYLHIVEIRCLSGTAGKTYASFCAGKKKQWPKHIKYKVTVLIISRIFLATTSVIANMDFSSFTTLQAHLDLL